MNISAMKSLAIPEGSAVNIKVGNNTIWRKHFIGLGDLNYELSEDGSHYTCVGIQDGVSVNSFTLADSVNGLPIGDVAADAFVGLTKPTVNINSEVNLDNAPWGANNIVLYIKGINYRQTTTTSRKPDYVCDSPNDDFKGGVVEILGRIGSIVVSELDSGTFKGYTSITEVIIPKEIRWIEAAMFQNCTNLKKATFKGTPDTVATSIFSGCTSLTEINVPWEEGAVSGAPWGATNATIHYNHTET